MTFCETGLVFVVTTALDGYFVGGVTGDEEGCYAHEEEGATAISVCPWRWWRFGVDCCQCHMEERVPFAWGVGRICGESLGIRLGSRRMQVFLIV